MKIRDGNTVISVDSIWIQCPYCQRKWNHKGRLKDDVIKLYASCPNCHSPVKIEKHRVR